MVIYGPRTSHIQCSLGDTISNNLLLEVSLNTDGRFEIREDILIFIESHSEEQFNAMDR